MLIVDAQAHVVSPDRVRYPFGPAGRRLAPWVFERGLSVEGLLREMDAAGVDRGMLVQPSSVYDVDNRYVADSVDAFPQRFAAIGAIALSAPDVLEQFDHWVRGRGFAGMRTFLSAPGRVIEPDEILLDPRVAPVWERASELHLPMKLMLTASSLRRVRALAERYPTLEIVVDHFGMVPVDDGPPYESARDLWALARCPRVNLLLSEHAVREANHGKATPRSFLERAVGTFGADRILWGSNFPSSPGTFGQLLGLAREQLAFLSERDRAAIFGGTARRLYTRLHATAAERMRTERAMEYRL